MCYHYNAGVILNHVMLRHAPITMSLQFLPKMKYIPFPEKNARILARGEGQGVRCLLNVVS